MKYGVVVRELALVTFQRLDVTVNGFMPAQKTLITVTSHAHHDVLLPERRFLKGWAIDDQMLRITFAIDACEFRC